MNRLRNQIYNLLDYCNWRVKEDYHSEWERGYIAGMAHIRDQVKKVSKEKFNWEDVKHDT